MKPISAILLFMLFIAASCCSSIPTHLEGMPEHHTTEGFRNYPLTDPEPSKGILFNLRRLKDYFSLPQVPRDHYLDEQDARNQYSELENENTLTWLGHSTFLIRIDGKTILTDPFLTDIASPFIIGPRRYVPPGIALLNLPKIDMIIVSHNHADHLDARTIEKLSGKDKIIVFVPLGLKEFFIERGYTHVTELDWNQEATVGEFHVEALPAIHNSGRKLFRLDWNKTLWCSWAISFPAGRVYFAGDTAYSSSIFKKIGEKFHSFDVAFLPIGAYMPTELLSMSHANPEEAVNIGKDINAKVLIPMHWGSIQLSDEPYLEPPTRFRDSALKSGYSNEQIWVMKIGETRRLPLTRECPFPTLGRYNQVGS